MAEPDQHPLPVPLLLPTLGWCIGIALATVLHLPLLGVFVAGAAVLTAGILFRFRWLFLLLFCLLAGFTRLAITLEKPQSPLRQILFQKESLTQPCSGIVLRLLNRDRGFYLVRLQAVNKVKVSEPAFMIYSKALQPGDRFNALAELSARKPDPVLDDTSFYYSRNSQKTVVTLKRVYRLEVAEKGGIWNTERLRDILLNSLDGKLGSSAPFAKALLLNDRTENKDWIQLLVQGGLLHLIAISGLHVMFFYFIFVNLFKLFLPPRISEIIFTLLMLAYAALCQWSPPVMRAVLMILLYVLAGWLQRPVAPLQIICLSLLIITLVSPLQLFSIGLQLSYLCILALLYLVPKRSNAPESRQVKYSVLYRIRCYLVDVVIVSVIVSFVMLPVMLYYFNRGSLNGIAGNIIAIPMVNLLLPLTFLLLLLPSHWIVFNWLKASYDGLLYLFNAVVSWTAGLPFYVDSISISLYLMIALLLVLTAILVRFKSGFKLHKLTYALLILSLPFFVFSALPEKKPFTLTVFNAGMGDCTLVEYPSGRTIMIDTGPKFSDAAGTEYSWFGSKIPLWQKHHRINTIDVLILTHLHDDHAGGIKDVFRTMRVRNVLISRQAAQSGEWQSWLSEGWLQEAQIHAIADTTSFLLAGSRVSILHPRKEFLSYDDNDYSLVVRIDYKGFSALLTGDITSFAERNLMREVPELLDADFLKVPHHGSAGASSKAFIEAISPSRAVITVSRYNRFHFPAQSTLKRYRGLGVEPELSWNGSAVVVIR